MKSIVYVGIDVHKDSYTCCCLQPNLYGEDRVFGLAKMEADSFKIVLYLEKMKHRLDDVEFLCGYEAGCMGYSLYHQLSARGINCVILAPTKMKRENWTPIKTDKRDAKLIAENLAYGTARTVYIPSAEDEMVKQYIRMRDDHKQLQKSIKQQINALCLREGSVYSGRTKWTGVHLQWLRQLELDWLMRETMNEYLATYEQLTDKLTAFEARIEELAASERYGEQVKRLVCFGGIRTYCALSLLVETGDFKRFPTAEKYAAYLGLVPSEQTSDKHQTRTGITKAGNRHLRRILIEASRAIYRGQIGHKSKLLQKRQAGSSAQVIAYADRANERLRRKYYRMLHRDKGRNVCVTAVARELACFIWGMMTGKTEARAA